MNDAEKKLMEKELSDFCESGDLSNVKKLLDNGANPNSLDSLPMRNACVNGHLDIVKLLVEKGVNIDKKEDFLEYSVKHEHIIKFWTDMGADLRKCGRSVILTACAVGAVSTVKLLLDCGIKVNGERCLRQSVYYRKLEIFKYFIKEHDYKVDTALSLAKESNFTEFADWYNIYKNSKDLNEKLENTLEKNRPVNGKRKI